MYMRKSEKFYQRKGEGKRVIEFENEKFGIFSGKSFFIVMDCKKKK